MSEISGFVPRTADDVRLEMLMRRFSAIGWTLAREADHYILLSPSAVRVWKSSSLTVWLGILQAIEIDRAEGGR